MNKKRKWTVAVLIITVIVFIFMGMSYAAYRAGDSAFAGNGAVRTVMKPMQKFFSGISTSVDDFFSYMHDLKTYKEDNLELMDKVDALNRQVHELEAYKKENDRLRSLLELKSKSLDDRMVFCEVISKDPGNWFDVFTIDKGSNHGIKKNDAVITDKGLVGRISDVGNTWAEVTTIIDSNSSVGVIIERIQEIALADGDLTLADQGKCRLDYIKNDISLVVGDAIETSGLGGIYPKGLFVGTVSEIKNDASGYSRYAIIDTAVDFEKIREVAVIKSEETSAE